MRRVAALGECMMELRHIDAETLKLGGYFPFGDHFVPPEVDWENYSYFRERLHAMMAKAGGR